jgi:cytochrome c-type biogenesis protein CcmH/NrfG
LSGAQDARERLGVLAQEARQLMLAAAEAKRQRLVRTRLLASLRRLAPAAEVAVFSLLLASVALLILLTVDRGL